MTTNQHNITWILVANSNMYFLYHYVKKSNQLILIKECRHPENRLKDLELTSDKPGRYMADASARGAYSQQTDPKEIKISDFAREIAKELEHARSINAYTQLIILAPPHMNGLVFKHLNKHVQLLIIHKIEKDVLHLHQQELLEFLHKEIN